MLTSLLKILVKTNSDEQKYRRVINIYIFRSYII